MKTIFTFVGLVASTIVLSINLSFAQTQTDPKQTDDVKVSVTFNPILSIAVNQTSVDLVFNTMDDYRNGVESNQAAHLTVFSTDKTYAVKVKALGSKFISGDKEFDVNNVSVQAASGTPVALATTEQTIYTGTQAGRDQNINVKYAAKGPAVINDAAINSEFIGKKFEATIVYTIAVN